MITDYLRKLRLQKRLSPSTIDQYRAELEGLESFNRDLRAIELHLSGCAPATHSRRLTIWRGYLRSIGDKLLDDFHRPKMRTTEVSFLNEFEIKIFEEYIERLSEEDQIFLALGLHVGLRLSEILQAHKSRIQGPWLLVKRKGGSEQRVALTEALELKLRTFEGFRKSKRYYQRLMHRIRRDLNLSKKITPHTLRHSFATQAVADGGDIIAIKEALGHRSLQATDRYLHVTPERQLKLVRRDK